MTPISLYIDADACPVKQEVYRVADRHALKGRPYNVMAGLVPAIHVFLAFRQKDVDARDNPRIESGDGHDGHQMSVSYKSSHSGFTAWMSRTFQARGQCLIVFSRWIADRISSSFSA